MKAILAIVKAIVATSACLAFWVAILLGLVMLASWWEEGYVKVGPRSEHLRLAGAPGDRIKLLLPLPADTHADYRETSALIRDPDTGVETVVPLAIEVDSDSEPERVYGWLVVPELPGGESRTLNGTLSGRATAHKATIGRFDVPLTLEVGPRGTIATSGVKDMTWQNRVAVLFALAVVVAVSVGVGVGVVTARSQARASEIGGSNGQPDPEARPSIGGAHPAQEGSPT